MDQREDLRVWATRTYPELRDPKQVAEYQARRIRNITAVMTLLIAFVMVAILPAPVKPFAFLLTLMLDMSLALYGYLKRY